MAGGVTDYIVKPLMFDRFKASLEGYQKDCAAEEKQSIIYRTNRTFMVSKSVKGNEMEYAPKGIDP